MAFFEPVPEEQLLRAGSSKKDVLDMIGIAAFWNLATTFGTATGAGLQEE